MDLNLTVVAISDFNVITEKVTCIIVHQTKNIKMDVDVNNSKRKFTNDGADDNVDSNSEKYRNNLSTIKITAVVATSHREDLLKSRALKSICEQTFLPEKVVVVIDERHDETNSGKKYTDADRVRNFLHAKLQNRVDVIVVFNNRTQSRSGTGAWNTGTFFFVGFVF